MCYNHNTIIGQCRNNIGSLILSAVQILSLKKDKMGGVRWGTLTLLVLDLMPIVIYIVGGGVLLSSALKLCGSADCIQLAQVIVEYKKYCTESKDNACGSIRHVLCTCTC
jgi:hypothetical protein